jgi:hypothetical protein
MGTRGAIGFHKAGVDKITYNHFDSYPSGLGNVMKHFFTQTSKEQIEFIFNKIIMIEEDAPITELDREQWSQFADEQVNAGEGWYSLLRDTQGNLAVYRDTDLPFMINNRQFMEDSLYCEWAYIYNLDEGVLEVYKGFQKEPQDNRYKIPEAIGVAHEYHNVALLTEIAYEDIPDFNMDLLEDQANGDDE